MKRIFKRTAVLVLAFLLCCTALLTADAAGGDPVNPTWSGTTATWQPPAKATSHYFVALYKDGGYLSDYTTSQTSYDFSDTIKNAGPGEYTFSVSAVFEDTSTSNTVSSNSFSYLGEGHPHPLDYVAFRYATCTEDGVKEHYECGVCNKYFWDAMALNEITDKSEVVLPANGHSWGEWKITKNPTTTAEGEAKRVCAEDSSHVEVKAIPKLKSESEAVTLPSDTEKTTAATQPSTDTTQPSTQPDTTVSATQPGTTAAKATAAAKTSASQKILRLPVMMFWGLVIAAVLVLVVAPAIVILLIVLIRRKKR